MTARSIAGRFAKLLMVLEGKKDKLLGAMERRNEAAAGEELKFEKAARLRDEIDALASSTSRGDVDKDVQPEVFHIDPKKGLAGCERCLAWRKSPRTIEGVDIAHLGGEDTVASLVPFIDGLPFKPGYRRFKIRRSRASTISPRCARWCSPVSPAARRGGQRFPTSS